MDLVHLSKEAPVFTTAIAGLAFAIAIISLLVQKSTAKFFLKTEMDQQMIEAHRKYRIAVSNLKAAPDIKVFADSPECHEVRSYLNVHELLAVGVLRGVFSNSVCRSYWINELKEASEDCNRLLLHIANDPAEKLTYVELVELNRRWQRGW